MGDAFQTTRWSLVLDARSPGPESDRALEALCRDYWAPLHRFAQLLGASPTDAEDYVQGFFGQVIAGDLFGRADPERGKLRTFLLTAFRRHVQDQWSKQNAQKRGGDLQHVPIEDLDTLPGETREQFDREWAAAVMQLALNRLATRYHDEGKGELHAALSPYVAAPIPDGQVAALAAACNLNENAAKVALHRLRKRFGEALRAEVADTLAEGEDIEAELHYLTDIVSNS